MFLMIMLFKTHTIPLCSKCCKLILSCKCPVLLLGPTILILVVALKSRNPSFFFHHLPYTDLRLDNAISVSKSCKVYFFKVNSKEHQGVGKGDIICSL